MCKTVQRGRTTFDITAPSKKRIAFLHSPLIDQPEVYDLVLKAIPDFYAGLLRLVIEDYTMFESIMRKRQPGENGDKNIIGWTNNLFCTIFRRINSGSAPDKFKGADVKRLLPFLKSDPMVWPSIMRVMKSLIPIRKAAPGLRQLGTTLFRAIGDVVAARSVAAFVLEHHYDVTTKTLDEIWTMIGDDPEEDSQPVGMSFQPIVFQITGVLDIWSGLFYEHE